MWHSFVGNPAKGISSVGRGLLTNVWMFLLCEVLILVLGLALAWTRMSRSPVLAPFRILATIYTDVFRGVPILLVILMVGFGVPALSLHGISSQSPTVYGCVALTVTYTAYVAEVFRAGIFSVHTGQLLAARSLGLSHASTMRRVILPQAVRTVIPPLLNDFISLQKDTALVSLLGVIEVVRAAGIYGSTEFNYSGYTLASLLFLALTVPMTRFTDHLVARDRSRRLAAIS
ncbi:MAG: amino acid ABC transporter permease [Acidobacteriota bacterium]|nr:amino acid ABC transporter permease [Acidobacteriota bacterium]